jgi:hypothetical protein
MGLTIVSHFSQTYKHTHTGILCVCDLVNLVVYCFASKKLHGSLKKSVEVIYFQLISYSQTDIQSTPALTSIDAVGRGDSGETFWWPLFRVLCAGSS